MQNVEADAVAVLQNNFVPFGFAFCRVFNEFQYENPIKIPFSSTRALINRANRNQSRKTSKYSR